MSRCCRASPIYLRTCDPPITNFREMSALFADLERVNTLPVLLHVHDSPTLRLGFSQSLVQGAERRYVIGILADGIGVVYKQSKARSRAGGGPLQHLQIAIRVA